MISPNEAKELAESKQAEARMQASIILDTAIKAACRLGERRVKLFKQHNLLQLLFDAAVTHGYSATIINGCDQRDNNYLVVEW